MKTFIDSLKFSLEKLDYYRDKILFAFIKPCWPRKLTPNHLTYIRIFIGLLLAILLFFFNADNKLLILSLFLIGALTDLFDGSVSRCLNETTAFGATMDPIADRILIAPIAVYSLYRFDKWLLLFLFLAEILGGLLSVFYKSKGAEVKVNVFGKSKMFLLSIVFVAILIAWPNMPYIGFIVILWTSLILSFLSMFIQIIDLKNQGLIKNRIINKQLNKYEAQSKNI